MSGASSGGIEGGGAAAGPLQCSQRGLRARDVTTEYSRGTPPMGTVRGYRRGTSSLWLRCSTAERPSPLRVCRYLSFNALTGSVPSSLSALTNLYGLCVAPSCQRRLHVRPRRVGIGRLCSERAACRGDACLGHRAGAVRQQGRCGALRGDLGAREVTEEYSRGIWARCAGAVGAHGCCGCGVAPPSGRVRFGCAATSATIR
jgi:hypothetical protein